MNRHRSTIQYRYRQAILVLGIVAVVVLAWWLMSDADSPVKVLGCVWDRATAESTATTDPSCITEP